MTKIFHYINHNLISKILYYYYKNQWKNKIKIINIEINYAYYNRSEYEHSIEYIQIWKKLVNFKSNLTLYNE